MDYTCSSSPTPCYFRYRMRHKGLCSLSVHFSVYFSLDFGMTGCMLGSASWALLTRPLYVLLPSDLMTSGARYSAVPTSEAGAE